MGYRVLATTVLVVHFAYLMYVVFGGFVALQGHDPLAVYGTLYLGAFGSALTFYLWSYALERTTPTRVAISVTVNPIAASLVGAAFLNEPLRWNLLAGIVMVFAGICIATIQPTRVRTVTP